MSGTSPPSRSASALSCFSDSERPGGYGSEGWRKRRAGCGRAAGSYGESIATLLETLALIGGAGLVLGFVVGRLLKLAPRRAIPIGVLLALGLPSLLYFLAPSDGPQGCSDCYESMGRWWLPRLAVIYCALNLLGWIA